MTSRYSTPPLVYVAGPYTAPTREGIEANIRAAEQLGVEVARLGAMPVIPHTNTSHPDFEACQPYQFWIDGTLELMRRCDAVITTDDWGKSSGARGEVAEALRRGMFVFEGVEDLKVWLETLARVKA